MLFSTKPTALKNSARFGQAMRTARCGLRGRPLMLGVQAFSGEMADAAPATMVLHYYQVQTDLTFYNASNVAIHHYPPLGGHVKEDDVDYVGSQASHAATWTVSDHLFCTVVSMPDNAQCFAVFAAGDGLIYCGQLRHQPGGQHRHNSGGRRDR